MTGRADRFDASHGHSPDQHRAQFGARGRAILTGALLLAASTQALAQAVPPGPAAGAVWGGCVLNEAAITALGATVDYVVVYSRSNPNDGQPLGAGFTGPVICINPDRVGITAYEADGATLLTPESVIPRDTDPGFDLEDDTTVNFLAAEDALILQYQPHGGPAADTEKRFCQTVGDLTDCFRIFPAGETPQ